MASEFIKKLTALALTSGGARAAAFFVLIILARWLDPNVYGEYVIFIAIIAVGQDLLNGQFYQALVREIPKRKKLRPAFIKAGLFTEIVAGLIASTVMVITLWAYQHYWTSGKVRITELHFLAIGMLLAVNYIQRGFLNIAHAENKIYILGAMELAQSVIFLGFIATLSVFPLNQDLLNSPLLIVYLLLCKSFSVFLSFLLFVKPIVSWFGLESKKKNLFVARKLISMSWFPLICGWLSVIYYNCDRLMLAWFGIENADIGAFFNAFTIGLIISFSSALFVKITFPTLASESTSFQENKYLTAYFNALIFVALPICILFYINAELIILTIFGADYPLSADLLKLYLPAVFFNISVGPGLSVLFIQYQQKFLMRCLLCACIVNITLNTLLIPQLGAQGAMIATAIGIFTNVALVQLKLLGLSKKNGLFDLKKIIYLSFIISSLLFLSQFGNTELIESIFLLIAISIGLASVLKSLRQLD